jgi:Adenosine-deaminase (editase) domain
MDDFDASRSIGLATSLAVFDKVSQLKQSPSVVSCFLLNNKIVSLGTGTKTFPQAGGALRDCHAEILAKRGFLVYLMRNVHNEKVVKNGKLWGLLDNDTRQIAVRTRSK